MKTQALLSIGVTFYFVLAVADNNATNSNENDKSHGGLSGLAQGIPNPFKIIFGSSSNDSRDGKDGTTKKPSLVDEIIEPAKDIAEEIGSNLKPIVPGTQWCGAGNRARSEDDLGVFDKSDNCCREHDNCPDNIPAKESKHGLENTGLFTRSNCECDDKFYDCLKNADTLISKKIGNTYFNVLRPQCFKLDYPVIGCSDKTGIILKRCDEYKFNTSAPRTWQWFDNKEF